MRGCGWLRASHLLRCAPRLGVARSGRESRLANRTGKPDLAARCLNISVALRIERDDTDRRPVASIPTPASRITLPRSLIDHVAGFEQTAILAGMTLCRGDIADAAVPVLMVVPLHESHGPLSGSGQIGEPLERELGTIFRGPEQRLGEGVVALQNPSPGALVAQDTVCIVKLSKQFVRKEAVARSPGARQ